MLVCDCMILYGNRFGVCCWFTLQNTGELSQNCTYVQNPGYPSAYTDTASLKYTIRRCSEGLKRCWIIQCGGISLRRIFVFLGVCSARLDFERKTIDGVADTKETKGGECATDKLAISVSTYSD